ncbi:MAG: PLP-dependent cysteine synthase family protein [Candidatus Kariarchaeaceae archaeon]|jgi:cysteine synthase A
MKNNVLDAIGNTSLVKLNKIATEDCANIYVKLEWENPTGSMKDRMAQAMIAEAEKDGRLKQGGTVVEYTGGSTGTSLALICAVKGYKIKIVTSDAFSKDKIDHMAALGADVTIIPSHGKGMTKQLFNEMIEKARIYSNESNSYWTDQLNNLDHIKGYHSLGEEIWSQTNGKVDAFVQSIGTSASINGVSNILRKHNPEIKIIAVEPGESPFLSSGVSGSHGIDGIGVGFEPPLWKLVDVDDILCVSTDDAKNMAKRLAREEGLFTGTSSGANVVAALKIAKELGPGNSVATLMIDSGLKYLSIK